MNNDKGPSAVEIEYVRRQLFGNDVEMKPIPQTDIESDIRELEASTESLYRSVNYDDSPPNTHRSFNAENVRPSFGTESISGSRVLDPEWRQYLKKYGITSSWLTGAIKAYLPVLFILSIYVFIMIIIASTSRGCSAFECVKTADTNASTCALEIVHSKGTVECYILQNHRCPSHSCRNTGVAWSIIVSVIFFLYAGALAREIYAQRTREMMNYDHLWYSSIK